MQMMRWVRATVTVVVVIGSCAAMSAQDAGQQPEKAQMMSRDVDPGWEVTTVRQTASNDTRDRFDVRGRHIIIENETVQQMLMFAYSLHKSQIAGTPGWANTARYDVDGLPNELGEPNIRQFQSMVRKLLAERFGLKAHTEQREMPVFALTVVKGGVKMDPSKGDPDGAPDHEGNGGDGGMVATFTNTSMQELSLMLLFFVNRPVVDQTGLRGKYDFKLKYTYDESRAPTDGSASPQFFTAMQEQAGLKLKPVRALADVLVIDKVEQPGAN